MSWIWWMLIIVVSALVLTIVVAGGLTLFVFALALSDTPEARHKRYEEKQRKEHEEWYQRELKRKHDELDLLDRKVRIMNSR